MTTSAQAFGQLRLRRRARTRRGQGRPPGRPGSRRLLHRLVPVVLVLLGIAVFVYPVLATQYNNVKQREFAQRYQTTVEAAAPAMLAEELAAAREYNASINGIPILDPWLTKVSSDPNSEQYQRYLEQLSGLGTMARIQVPGIAVDLPIYHGTKDDVLAKGVGHLYGTSLPVGGKGTHAVLTSHTGLSSATLFDNLVDVEEGDVFYVDVSGETLAYQVDQIKVVLPSEVSDLVPVAGEDLVTLVTCTPYAVNSHRLLVRGHRVPYEAAAAVAPPEAADAGFQLEPWMWWLLGGAALGLLALTAMVVGTVRRTRRQRAADDVLAGEAPGSVAQGAAASESGEPGQPRQEAPPAASRRGAHRSSGAR